MDVQKVDMYIAANGSKFPAASLPSIRERLLQCDDRKWATISVLPLKDPIIALILAIFLGDIGVDRFYIGHVGLGLAKLIACVLLCWTFVIFIWPIVDIFLIMGATREENLKKLNLYLSY